tara:strand:- start:150 stop:296 length:147 start_codon:yes stop_codon:yes gene_type:complete
LAAKSEAMGIRIRFLTIQLSEAMVKGKGRRRKPQKNVDFDDENLNSSD